MKREYPKQDGQSVREQSSGTKQVEEHNLQFYESIHQLKPGAAPVTRKYTRDYSKDQPQQEDMFGSTPMMY